MRISAPIRAVEGMMCGGEGGKTLVIELTEDYIEYIEAWGSAAWLLFLTHVAAALTQDGCRITQTRWAHNFHIELDIEQVTKPDKEVLVSVSDKYGFTDVAREKLEVLEYKVVPRPKQNRKTRRGGNPTFGW